MLAEKLPRRPMRGLVAVKRDGARQSTLALERPTEKRFGRRDIPLCAEKEIDGFSLLVDSAVEIKSSDPLSSRRSRRPARIHRLGEQNGSTAFRVPEHIVGFSA